MENIFIQMLGDYVDQLKSIYRDKLVMVSLFGSYARGDYHRGSDVDIMIVLDIPQERIPSYDDALCEATFRFNVDKEVDIEPVTVNKAHFQKWMTVYPFYQNICSEGVILYESEAA